MGRVVDGRVNGAPFAGIVLTAGSVLRADDAAGPVLSKKMEDTPIAGWYTIDGGQTPEDDIIEVKRERPPRLVLVDAADMALPVGAIRLLDKRDAFASLVDSDRRNRAIVRRYRLHRDSAGRYGVL